MANLLDTDVVSQRIKPLPDEKTVRWLSIIPREDTYISVVTLQELRTGVELLPVGRKRRDLESWLTNDIPKSYEERILPITAEIADLCGRILSSKDVRGFHLGVSDAYIAATARVHGLTVATLNRKHFERLGVELVEF